MSSASASSRVIVPTAIVASFLVSIAILPVSAAAQTSTASIQTGELLPPGQNTCQQVTATNIQPYVYGGVLESFDVTISDTSNSYVGAFAEVGNMEIPLNFITRWAGSPTGLRIHVDTPNTPVNGSLPVNLTLLASLPGAPTCITTVTFDVTGQGISASSSSSYPSTTTTIPSGPTSSTVPTYPISQATQPSAPSSPAAQSQSTASRSQTSISSSSLSMATTSALGASVVSASNAKFLGSVCSGNNAFRLWLILLVIYLILVAIVVFAEPWFLESSVIGSTAAILVPLILLLGFWYFSDACRAASWIPVVACVIAIAGLFLAFREYELPPLLPAPSEQ